VFVVTEVGRSGEFLKITDAKSTATEPVVGQRQLRLFLVMAFNPLTLLTLKYRGRNVAVHRYDCENYEVSRTMASRLLNVLSDNIQSIEPA
jgi:hypothetical protein